MKTTVLSTMKNEAPFILEWVAHYKALGFDALYVATNDCADTTTHILDRLQEMGLLVHHPTVHWARSTPHKSALRQLQGYKAVKRSDWIFVCDVDEFLNIHVGDGSLRALLDHHGGRSDAIHVPWRIFGSGGIAQFADEWVTRQFRLAEPPPSVDQASGARAKALFRNPRRFRRFGVHAPLRRDGDDAPFVSVLPDGTDATDWPARGFDVAQLNHYALRSADSYEVKKQRGRAHHVTQALGDEYWDRYDRNHERDESIARYEGRVQDWYDRLRSDAVLDELHRVGVAWHEARARGDDHPLPQHLARKGTAMIEKREFYIDGKWVAPSAPRDCDVIDPSTEEAVAVISLGDQADTDAAVAAAKRAFETWSVTPPATRRAVVERILEQYEARAEEMAQAISMEMGAPIKLARNSQAPCLPEHLKAFLTAFDTIEWVRPLGDHAPNDRLALEPIGVVGLITPWNWPMNQVTLKVIPALLAGCTCVLKPSEEAPLSSLLFAEFCHDAGVPAGVFNLVNGDGAGVGSQLSSHPDVEMISFTGSTRAGRAISKAAAETMKRVTLELGGKGANLIFADADDRAVERGAKHCFNNSGQSCNAPTRMLVERPAYDRAVEIAGRVAQETRVAAPSEDGNHIGPVVNQRQWDQIQGYIQKGIDEGARLVAGGLGRPEGLNRGFYVQPTVFADVTPGMTIEREEIFGPVLSIIPFDTEEEAVRIANDTAYGLTNYVQSQDGERRNRLARKLRSGMVEMNGQSRGAGSPFGGVKASGRAREGGTFGIEEFLEVKAISGWG